MEAGTVKWLPEDYLDEWIPPPRDSPSAWITNAEKAGPALDHEDWLAGDDRDTTPLVSGQIVKFCKVTYYGEATLILSGDKWSVDVPMPPQAQTVCVLGGWKVETISDNVEEVAQHLQAYGAGDGEYRLSYYTWSDAIPFMFDEASMTFVEVAGA